MIDNPNHLPQVLRTVVRLDQVVEGLTPYCHEVLDAVPPDDLDDLMIELVRHGPPDDLEFFVDEHGRQVLIKGHRWVRACRMLAQQALEGFAPDMVLPARQVIGANPDCLLLRSTEDVTVRYRLDLRTMIARLRDAGIGAELAARALGISLGQYRHYITPDSGMSLQS